MAKTAISAILPYFGGKRTLAPRIVQEFGKHSAYAEICCGSLAPLMAKPRAPMEIANDLYGHVINLARVLASSRHAELQDRLSRTLMHDAIFDEAKSWCHSQDTANSTQEVRDESVEAAYWFFVLSWMGRNGMAGTKSGNQSIATRYTSNGGSGGFRWQQAVDSVPAWHDRLRGVHFKQMDCVQLASRLQDAKGWVIYVDPPYIRKGSKYVCDFELEDHARLASVLQEKREARVVVSYYDEPELVELYPGWTKVHMPPRKGLANSRARGDAQKSAAPEVLLINGPSIATAAQA